MSQETQTSTETAAPSQEGIQPGLAARAEAMNHIAQAREDLGHVSLQMDASGNLLTPREQQQERQFVHDQGHASNETVSR